VETLNKCTWRASVRFSLRSLFFLVLLIGGWLGWIVHRARVQRDAVAVIERAGGKAWYDWEWQNGNPVPNGRPRWPKWLVDRIGVDYFGHVTTVFARHSSDAELAHIGNLSRLEYLILGESPVTDAGLVHLERLNNLRALNLQHNTNVSDAGLVHLKSLTSLRELGLGDTAVSDAGLVHIKRMPHLTALGLEGTNVGDAGLVHLKSLTTLQVLSLGDAPVTDAGVRKLQKALPKVKIRR
jgi:internalin A